MKVRIQLIRDSGDVVQQIEGNASQPLSSRVHPAIGHIVTEDGWKLTGFDYRPCADRADWDREVEIVGIGGERDYSLADVKRAFWKMFHEAGEVWFFNLGTPEENTCHTEQGWQVFQDGLVASPEKTFLPEEEGHHDV